MNVLFAYTAKRILTAAVRAVAVSFSWEIGERLAKRIIPLKPKPKPRRRRKKTGAK